MKKFINIVAFMLVVGFTSCNEKSIIEGTVEDNTTATTSVVDVGNFKIKNLWKSTYLNYNSAGNLICVSSSVYWNFLNIIGVNNNQGYYIKNASNNVYLAIDATGKVVLSVNRDNKSTWIMETVSGSSTYYRLKNLSSNSYLNIETLSVQCTAIQTSWYSAQWIFLN